MTLPDMKTTTPQRPQRQDRRIQERVHDTYKLRGKLTEPTRCPQCAAVYHNGRWIWSASAPQQANEQLCSACHRINDNYPAGEVTLSGSFVKSHEDEIIRLARNIEATEKDEHPMNRIISVRDQEDGLLITTTDVHLPQRIAKAIRNAWSGELDIHFDNAGYFTSIVWHRDD